MSSKPDIHPTIKALVELILQIQPRPEVLAKAKVAVESEHRRSNNSAGRKASAPKKPSKKVVAAGSPKS